MPKTMYLNIVLREIPRGVPLTMIFPRTYHRNFVTVTEVFNGLEYYLTGHSKRFHIPSDYGNLDKIKGKSKLTTCPPAS